MHVRDAGDRLGQHKGLGRTIELIGLVGDVREPDSGFFSPLLGGSTSLFLVELGLHSLGDDAVHRIAVQAGENAGGLPAAATVDAVAYALSRLDGDAGVGHGSDHRCQRRGLLSLVDGEIGVLRLDLVVADIHLVGDSHLVGARIGGSLSAGTVHGIVDAGEGLNHFRAAGRLIGNQALASPVVGINRGLDCIGSGSLIGRPDGGGGLRAFIVVFVSWVFHLDCVFGVGGQPLKQGAGLILAVIDTINSIDGARDGRDRDTVGTNIAGRGDGRSLPLGLVNGQGRFDRIDGSIAGIHLEGDFHLIDAGIGGGSGRPLVVHIVLNGALYNARDGSYAVGDGAACVISRLRLQVSGPGLLLFGGKLGGGRFRFRIVLVLGLQQLLVEGVLSTRVQVLEHRALLPNDAVPAVFGTLNCIQGDTGRRAGLHGRRGTSAGRLVDSIADPGRRELLKAGHHGKLDNSCVGAGIHRR